MQNCDISGVIPAGWMSQPTNVNRSMGVDSGYRKEIAERYKRMGRTPILIWQASESNSKKNRLQAIISSMLHNDDNLIIRVYSDGRLMFRSVKISDIHDTPDHLITLMESVINMKEYYIKSDAINEFRDFLIFSPPSQFDINKDGLCHLIIYYSYSRSSSSPIINISVEDSTIIYNKKTEVEYQMTVEKTPVSYHQDFIRLGEESRFRLFGNDTNTYRSTKTNSSEECFGIVITMSSVEWNMFRNTVKKTFGRNKNIDGITFIFTPPTETNHKTVFSIVENHKKDKVFDNISSVRFEFATARSIDDIEGIAPSIYIMDNAKRGKMVKHDRKNDNNIRITFTKEIISSLSLPFIPTGKDDNSKYHLAFSHTDERVILFLRSNSIFGEVISHYVYYIVDTIDLSD